MKKFLFLAAVVALASCHDPKKDAEKICGLLKEKSEALKSGNDISLAVAQGQIDVYMDEAKKNYEGDKLKEFESALKPCQDEAAAAEIAVDAKKLCDTYIQYMDAEMSNDTIKSLDLREKLESLQKNLEPKYKEGTENFKKFEAELAKCLN
ncbi:MAG: hypothetical protein FJX90_06030 [Bacteroidetes bacterium]|nr:hypothetical protein [Bacteroidota bacterium]